MKWIEIIIAGIIATLILPPVYKSIDKKIGEINLRSMAKFLAGCALFFVSYLLADIIILMLTGEKFGLL